VLADSEVCAERVIVAGVIAELAFTHSQNPVFIPEVSRTEESAFPVAIIEIFSDSVEASAHVEADGEKVTSRVLLGADVDMCARIVGKGSGGIYFTDGDVLYGRGREEVERNQLVVRVGRGDGQTVQGGRAVPVTQSAYYQLSGACNGDTGYFLDSVLYVRYTFQGHLFGSHVFDGKRCFLSLLQ